MKAKKAHEQELAAEKAAEQDLNDRPYFEPLTEDDR
jgi:hypothetical protein